MKDRSSSRALAGIAVALVACVAATSDQPADACSSSVVTMTEATTHPDLPLDRFAEGKLGLVRPTFARSYLVVAWRALSGAPLDDAERRAALALWTGRLTTVEPSRVSSATPAPTAAAPAPAPGSSAQQTRWENERARVLGVPRAWVHVGYTTKSYAWVVACKEDAFRVAADTLADREATAPRAELVEWTKAQDQVFGACGAPATATIPAALPASASARARADREYQIAAAHLYANHFDEAERRFRAIGADRASPWRRTARYLVVRTMARRAQLAQDKSDAAGLGRALAELDRLRVDSDMASMSSAMSGYRGYLRSRADPAGALADAAAKVARPAGVDLGQHLDDYTRLIDDDERALEKATDDLTVWIGLVQGKRPAAEAIRMYNARKTLPWLVAALVRAERADDRALDAILADALAVPKGSPGFATARYHFLRLSAARGVPRTTLADQIQRTRHDLPPDVGPSTSNAFALLAARHAPTVARLFAEAAVRPAGVSEDSGPAVADPKAPRALPPEIVEMLNARLPVSAWADAAAQTSLPADVRAHVAAVAYVRAMLLGERKVAAALAPTVSRTNPSLAPFVQRIEQARTEDERRLSLVYAILKVPSLGPDADAWTAGEAKEAPIDSSYGGFFWCTRAAATADPIGALGEGEHAAAEREHAALVKLGAGATWLGEEAARLADALPADPRAPEALHLAVRATRYGCKDGKTPAASKHAFQVLHRRFPKSVWAQRTPYHY